MAVKGLDIFKLSPKKNCKECGSPTCMAFCMKVAQGAVPITKCPYMSEEAVALLSEATAPPMKTIEVGTHKLGGETVMMRHEKTLVNRNLFAATLATDMDDAAIDARIEGIKKVDYERIGEREMVECVFVHDAGDSAKFVELCKKAAALPARTVIIDTKDVDTAKAAVEAIKDNKPILNGANKDNFAAMSEIAKAAGLVLGVSGKDLSELHDTVAELEKAGNKNLILDVTAPSAIPPSSTLASCATMTSIWRPRWLPCSSSSTAPSSSWTRSATPRRCRSTACVRTSSPTRRSR